MSERPLGGAVDDTIEIRDDGSIVATEAARSRLSEHRGTWRAIADGGDLLVLRRHRPERSADRGIQFLGSINGSESLLSALHFFAMGQESGTLVVESDSTTRTLYLHRGKLLSARSSRREDRLGQILLADKLVTREQLEACFSEAEDADLLGRTLLRHGHLNNHQIYEALRRQTQEIFTGVMLVERGVFYLVKPLDMTEVPAMLHLDIQELLFEGLRRSDELKHLRRVVPSDDIALAITGATAPPELSAEAAQLFGRLDGRTSLAEHLSALELDALTGLKAAVELIERGLAAEASARPAAEPDDPDDPTVARARAVVAPYERAMEVVLAALSPSPGPRRRELVAMFLRSTESFTELLAGVEVSSEGALDTETLIARANAGGAEGLELLRRCLHELLFFLLFEVGQRGDQDLFSRLHQEVADILSRPRRGRDTGFSGQELGASS